MVMIARLPFTLLFLLVMIANNIVAGTVGGTLPEQSLESWGISHTAVRSGDVLRLLTGTFLSHDVGMLIRQFFFVACVIGVYEWVAGTWRAVGTFFLIDVIGTLAVLFAILPGLVLVHPSTGSDALNVYDVGMSAGGFGLLGALAARQRYSGVILGAICIAIFIKIWISFDLIADTAHLLCLLLGFVLEQIRPTNTR